jgi:hypothetical protein
MDGLISPSKQKVKILGRIYVRYTGIVSILRGSEDPINRLPAAARKRSRMLLGQTFYRTLKYKWIFADFPNYVLAEVKGGCLSSTTIEG